ncbi:hypothetical protein PanWU01x14_157750 [Parasponia andersonii]|uniref:Uncharacterized protein n=1 Tax=Parasponia andersonii TaxID=3476 RepID=A0A2P5CFB8_PARAD|nr:hypothetical protein PanWU01x14_157750 [Parasponia andersonii]
MRAVQLENASVFGSHIFLVSASYICKCCRQPSSHNQWSLPNLNSAFDPLFREHLNQSLSSFVSQHVNIICDQIETHSYRKGIGREAGVIQSGDFALLLEFLNHNNAVVDVSQPHYGSWKPLPSATQE